MTATGSEAIQVGANWSITTFNPQSSVVTFAGIGFIQTATTFANLTIGASGNTTLQANIGINAALNVTAGGILSAGSFTVTMNGAQWTNSGTFAPGTGTVTFTLTNAATTLSINGSNSWYNFSVTAPSAYGKTINFEHLTTQTIVAGGSFTVTGGSGLGQAITLSTDSQNATVNGASPPGLVGQWVITNLSATPPNVNYAIVAWSWATTSIIPGASVVDGTNNHNWIFSIPIMASWTLDTTASGRIDRIRVQVQPGIALNDNFTGLQVQVQGYTVVTFAAVGANTDVFDILLQNGPQEDTNATPSWQVTSNTTLASSVGGALVARNVGTTTKQYVAASGARPVITYTLAALSATRAYVHFSEPVYGNQTATTAISGTSLSLPPPYSGGPITVQPVEMIGSAAHAAIITFSTPLAVNDILAGAQTIVAGATGIWSQVYPSFFDYPTNQPAALQSHSPGDPGAYTNTNLDGNLPPSAPGGPPYSGRAMLAGAAHNISDVGLGFVIPVLAQDQEITRDPTRGGIGMVTTFDGTKWLPPQNTFLEARVMPPGLAGATVTLYWDVNPPIAEDFNNLWIPPGATTLWPGNVNGDRAHTPGDTQARGPITMTGINGPLRDFIIPSADPAIKDGALFQFMFLLNDGAGHVLPCALPAADPSNPAGVGPFKYMIRALIQQRGSVTITNNVIRPDNGQTAYLHYTLSTAGQVTVTVFDFSGSIVNVLQRGPQGAGEYTTAWDGKNRGGRAVARGIYFIRVVGPGFDEIRKVLVVR